MNRQALVVGASRGLGLVLADELLRRNWRVVATSRGADRELRALGDASDGRLVVEPLEMTDPAQLEALHGRLGDSRLDLLFVNAAIDRGD
ncbi:MAG: SDR family NAD(P)-dependent oxidoreductase, partial [Alphaproteobacteria bacterium]